VKTNTRFDTAELPLGAIDIEAMLCNSQRVGQCLADRGAHYVRGRRGDKPDQGPQIAQLWQRLDHLPAPYGQLALGDVCWNRNGLTLACGVSSSIVWLQGGSELDASSPRCSRCKPAACGVHVR
jgi:hypothetical protein